MAVYLDGVYSMPPSECAVVDLPEHTLDRAPFINFTEDKTVHCDVDDNHDNSFIVLLGYMFQPLFV